MGSDEGRWRADVRDARKRLGLGQRELAARAGVSYEALRKYESGARHPSRPQLIAILDALKLDRTERNAILQSAGFASDWQDIKTPNEELGFTLETAQVEVDRIAWPCFVMNEMSEVIVANAVAQRLWDVDLRAEFTAVADRSLLAVASTPRFADRLANWDEAIGTLVSVFKGHHRGPEDLDNPSPMFQSVIERFLAGDPQYIARFLRLWQDAPPAELRMRWHYPVVWGDPRAGCMRFDCVVSEANDRDGWAFNDWIPVDAESWANLARLMSQ